MIYICIPSHNEEQTVGVVLWKIRQVMAELGRDYQLLVADDGSTDRTAEVLEPYTRVLPLTVMRSAECRGYAASLEMLLREAVARSKYPRRDAAVVLQADFTEDPEHIGVLLKRLESGADIVASNPASENGREPLLRRWARAWAGRVVRKLTWPDDVRDPLTGFCAYRISTIRQAIAAREGARLLSCEGGAANAELLRAAAPHARRIDAVEFTPKRERLQRPSRFRPLEAVRRARSLQRGNGQPSLDVEGLTPTDIIGGVSRRISTAAAEERPRRNGRPRRPQRADVHASGGETGERKKRTRRGGRKRAAGSSSAPAAQQAAPQAANGAAEENAAEGAAAGPKKRRRGRRGGRGRRRKPSTTPQNGDATPAPEGT